MPETQPLPRDLPDDTMPRRQGGHTHTHVHYFSLHPLTRHQQHHAAKLPPHILLLHIMSVLDLAPHLGLPVDLNADSLRGLLDAKRGGLLPAVRGLQRGAPLADQPSGCEEALAGQSSPLHTGQVPAAETHQPAADDVAHAGRLGLGQEAAVVEGRLDGNAGPDLGLEVGDDGPGRFLLRLAERAPVGGLIASCRRPAQQCVGVEVPEHRVDDRSADRATGGVIGGQVDRTAHQARERDQVLFGSLLCALQLVPLDSEGVCQLRFGEGYADDLLGGRVS